jgi:hypothetical protein
LFSTRSAIYLYIPFPTCSPQDRLFICIHLSMGMEPSRAALRRLLICVHLSMGNETLQSYTSPSTFFLQRAFSLSEHRLLISACCPLFLVANLLG